MYPAPRKKTFPLGCLTACCVLLLALAAGPVQAIDYTVGGPAGPDNYATLQALQTAHGTLGIDDRITFFNSDNTLGSAFGLADGDSLTLDGNGSGPYTISANGNTRFLNTTGAASINITWSDKLTFNGFSASSDFGGAVYVDHLNGAISGNFTNNTAGAFGGAVHVFTDLNGDISGDFTGNTAGGRGGAVSVGSGMAGTVTGANFTNNHTTGANANGGALSVGTGGISNGIINSTFDRNYTSSANSSGGAVFSQGALNGGIDKSTFTGNETKGVGVDGGAVWADSFGGGITNGSTFENNKAGGSGGAMYVRNDFGGGIADSTFQSNQAGSGGNGGAIYVGGAFSGGITNSKFIGNTLGAGPGQGGALNVNGAFSGGIAGSTFQNNKAGNEGEGGAVYLGGAFGGGITNSKFLFNQALSGGAIYLSSGGIDNISGQSVFDGNQAVALNGGSSGAGGAIALNDGNLTVTSAVFVSNKAVGEASDPSSGRGGAIYSNTFSSDRTVTLAPRAIGDIFFENNTMSPAGSAAVPNSIYFANNRDANAGGTDRTSTLNVNTVANTSVVMLDPLASQADNSQSDMYDLPNLTVNVNKNGPGVWVLGGVSNMAGGGAWNINNGALHLVNRADNTPAHINLSHAANASFTLGSGAALLVEPGLKPHQITAREITLASGSQAGVSPFIYGQALKNGRYTVLKLNAPDIDNQSAVPVSKGKIQVGILEYFYKDLAWNGNNLDMTVYSPDPGPGPDPGPRRNRDLAGDAATTAPLAILLQDTFNKTWFRRADLRFDGFDRPGASSAPAAGQSINGNPANQVWLQPLYAYTNQSSGSDRTGFDLNTPGLALGYDHAFSQDIFAGIGFGVSWPEFEGGGVDIDATEIALALYGGARLPLDIRLSALAGMSWFNYDQTRHLDEYNESYDADYDGRLYTVGVGLSRPFALSDSFSLGPLASYEYLHLSVDGYSEGNGERALNMDDDSLDLHRLKLGLEGAWQDLDSGLLVSARAYYMGLYGNRNSEVDAFFNSDPAGRLNGFSSVGDTMDENNLGLGLNLDLPLSDSWSVGGGYNVLFGSTTTSQEGNISATFKF